MPTARSSRPAARAIVDLGAGTATGTWDGEPYTYSNVVMVGGGAGPSPHSADFDPYYIRRTQAIQTELDYWLTYFAERPEFYYVSAGPEEK